MKRAKILAVIIYAALTAGTLAFVHYPDLETTEAQEQVSTQRAVELTLQYAPAEIRNRDLQWRRAKVVYAFEMHQPGNTGIIGA
jgi:hypothetical protein